MNCKQNCKRKRRSFKTGSDGNEPVQIEIQEEEPRHEKLFSLVLAVAMVLSMACFASAEENTTLTIVAWDVGTTPYYQA